MFPQYIGNTTTTTTTTTTTENARVVDHLERVDVRIVATRHPIIAEHTNTLTC